MHVSTNHGSRNLFGGQVLVKQAFMYLGIGFIRPDQPAVKENGTHKSDEAKNDEVRRLIDVRKDRGKKE